MPNVTLTELFENQSVRLCSLEISSQKAIDYKKIGKLNISYFSVIWIGCYDKPPNEIEPLQVVKNLIAMDYAVVLHFPGRSHTKETAKNNLDYAKRLGVKNLLCVQGVSRCEDASDYDFPHASDLLRFIKTTYGDFFDLSVAANPYMEPDNMEREMSYLKQKVDSGAKFIVTQGVFSHDALKRFRENCEERGIRSRIIPLAYVMKSSVDFCILKQLCKVPLEDSAINQVKNIGKSEKLIAEYVYDLSRRVVEEVLNDKQFCPPCVSSLNDFDTVLTFFLDLNNYNVEVTENK